MTNQTVQMENFSLVKWRVPSTGLTANFVSQLLYLILEQFSFVYNPCDRSYHNHDKARKKIVRIAAELGSGMTGYYEAFPYGFANYEGQGHIAVICLLRLNTTDTQSIACNCCYLCVHSCYLRVHKNMSMSDKPVRLFEF